MRIDQARDHCPSAAIDHSRAFRRRRAAAGDLRDAIAFDKEPKSASQRFGFSVKELEVCEYDRRRGACGRSSRTGRRQKAKRGKGGACARDKAAPGEIPVDAARSRRELGPATKTERIVGNLILIGGRARKHFYLRIRP
ncbi:MAG TPA: hypothetical protein VHU22_04745 [Xanthobacteraceae bacterium]|nr:hypothetical protein [Xanthobacteraceae bacterium]